MDGIHPVLEALRIVRGVACPWRGPGSSFHYGALQAWLLVPLVACAGRLEHVLAGVAVLHGLAALPVGLAARRAGGWCAALVAALLMAAWPILVAHPHHGSYTYQAPVLLAVGAWALARGGRWLLLAAAALAAAPQSHPYALAPSLGALATLPVLRRRARARTLLAAAGLALLVAAPWVVDNLLVLLDPEIASRSVLEQGIDRPGLGPLARLAAAWSASLAGIAPPLTRMLGTAPLWILVGAGLAGTRNLPFLWATGAGVLFVLQVLALDYVQPYHVAVLVPPLALGAGWGVQQAWRAATARLPNPARLTAALLVGWLAAPAAVDLLLAHPLAAPTWNRPLGQRHLGVIEKVAEVVIHDAAGRPRALALLAESPRAEVGDAVVHSLAQWMRGEPDTAFPHHRPPDRPVRAYVLASLTPAAWTGMPPAPPPLWSQPSRGGTVLRLLAFADTRAARAWLRGACAHPEWRISGPFEALGGVAGAPRAGPDRALVRWAEPCRP